MPLDHGVKRVEIFVPQRSKTFCDLRRIPDFWANQPKREDERQASRLTPCVGEIPKPKFTGSSLPKRYRLIPDHQLRAPDCRRFVRLFRSDHTRAQMTFR